MEEGESLIPKCRKLCSWGVVNYLPSLDPGEDDGTQAKYIEKIKEEWTSPSTGGATKVSGSTWRKPMPQDGP